MVFKKSPYGCFRKQGYPQIIHFNSVFHHKPTILGYPYFGKHPYNWASISSPYKSRKNNRLGLFFIGPSHVNMFLHVHKKGPWGARKACAAQLEILHIFCLVSCPDNLWKKMYLVNRLETNCRIALIPFNALWGLCCYDFCWVFRPPLRMPVANEGLLSL